MWTIPAIRAGPNPRLVRNQRIRRSRDGLVRAGEPVEDALEVPGVGIAGASGLLPEGRHRGGIAPGLLGEGGRGWGRNGSCDSRRWLWPLGLDRLSGRLCGGWWGRLPKPGGFR